MTSEGDLGHHILVEYTSHGTDLSLTFSLCNNINSLA